MSNVIWVRPERESPYPVLIGADLFSQQNVLPELIGERAFILTSESIAPLHLAKVQNFCEQQGLSVDAHILPDGEQQKNLANFEKVCTILMEKQYGRDAVLFALGGGVIGDLAGFVAACYLRGIDFVQCPTSLLSAVDAAIGGKTGINHPLGKNLIGALHQPKKVLVDLDCLNTLPMSAWRSGLAEIVKYGVAFDSDFFDWLENHYEQLLACERAAVLHAVTQSVTLKAEIVSQDLNEQDKRILLNFGHTIGHALEAVMGYQGLTHGEAVSIGMLGATYLSEHLGLIDNSVGKRLKALLIKMGLPTKIPDGMSISAICQAMQQDKKHQNQKLRWVLLIRMGQCTVDTVSTLGEVTTVLKRLGASG